MQNNKDRDLHFAGTFCVLEEKIPGELIYNEENGKILINLVKLFDNAFDRGKAYGNLEIITGILHSGETVTLFHNRCIYNSIRVSYSQELSFVADYLVWSKKDAKDTKYNKLVCILENALNWSGLSAIDTSDISAIKINRKSNKNNIYHWFGANISFSTSLKSELYNVPRIEESTVVEHLEVSIEMNEKQDISSFIAIRNKVISLISFAIKDNVNIVEQYLNDYADSYIVNDIVMYYEHYLYTSEPRLIIYGKRHQWDYNFTLAQLSPDKDIQKELDLLCPIFNLYLSLIKYKDMPIEMIFLNIVQALETFHVRFFYDDSKDKYIESVHNRFGTYANYSFIEKLLLPDKQINAKNILLVSRLNDLLVGKYNGLFWNYYGSNPDFAQIVTDTRHYYTHYIKEKEEKALKGDKLIDAVRVLSMLLEYNVCLQLGIDNNMRIRERLSSIATSQEIQRYYQKENEHTS